MSHFAVFLVSLGVLAITSRFVISSSIKISEYFKISEVAIGYLLIAITTSVPDIMVAVTASSGGMGGMALGDLLGSSIATICLVLGSAAMIKSINVKREQSLESAELLLMIAIIPLVLLARQGIGFNEGLILVVIFFIYALFAFKEKFTMGLKEGIEHKDWMRQLTVFLFSIVVMMVCSQFIVNSGAEIARDLGVEEALIGMTMIAFATTLPEIAIDFTAIRKGHFALAIGDVFGSCVVNLTLGLGLAAMINPLANGIIFLETAVAFLVGIVIFLWYVLMKHEGIRREHGLIFVLAYVMFIMLEMIWGVSSGNPGALLGT
jgi:cation:H+ antiporter